MVDQVKQTLRQHEVLSVEGYASKEAEVDSKKLARAALKAAEADEQRALVLWLRESTSLFGWHTPNELTSRSVRQGAINKALGVEPGIPDLVVTDPIPDRPEVRGVAIELKVEGRKPTPAQIRVMKTLRSHGWLTFVCQGADEAKTVLTALYGL